MTSTEDQQHNRESILTAEKAPSHEIDFDKIPQFLKALPRWVNWKWSQVGKKWTKVPVHPKGYNASSTDQSTWSDFATVVQANLDHGYGVGFVFNNDGLVGIDIDDCRNPQTGAIALWAMYLIQTLDSYAEVSPSGTGVKLFLTGTLPEQFRKKHNRTDGNGGVEIFASGRFFTVTGLHIASTLPDIQNRNDELNRVYLDCCDWKPITVAPKPSTYVPQSIPTASSDRDTAVLALTAISNNPGLDYDDWLNVGMALHSVDVGLLGEWESWSRESEKYADGECVRKWHSFTGGKGVGIGTLCHMADQTGKTWRPQTIRQELDTTPEAKLKGQIELAYMELGAGRTIEQVAPSLINVLTSCQRQPNEPNEAEEPDPGMMPSKLLEMPGLLGEIVHFFQRGSIRPQLELAVAAAIAIGGTLMGRKVKGHFNTRTNIYIIGLGESGCGKDRARKGAVELFECSGLQALMPCEDVGSGAGLLDAVVLSPAMLLMMDEIHQTLATTKDARNNPHMFEVVGILLKLFTSSSSTYLGKALAGKKRETRINQPCLSLYGTGIPKGVWQSLTSEQLENGFLSRLLIVESSNSDPAPIRNPNFDPPDTGLIDQFKWWGAYTPPGNELNVIYSAPRLVTDGAGVTDLFADGEEHFRRQRRPGQAADGLWNRATEKARKLALIHQLSRDREAESIDHISAQWALDFVEHVTRRTLFHANVWVSDTKHGNDKLAVLRIIRNHGGRATVTQISRGSRGLKTRERDEILFGLVQDNSIRMCPIDVTNGRPTLCYELVV